MSGALSELVPHPHDAELAREALARMQPVLDDAKRGRDAPMTISLDDNTDPIVVPRSLIELMSQVLVSMAAGEGITVVPAHAELTTQQAANLLNVSRPYLIGLLEDGEIDFRTVGTHRRVLAASLVTYMRRDDAARRQAADDLAALTRGMKLA